MSITQLKQQLELKMTLGQHFPAEMNYLQELKKFIPDEHDILNINSQMALLQWAGQQPETADLADDQRQAEFTEVPYHVMPVEWQNLLGRLFKHSGEKINEEVICPLTYILNVAVKQQWCIAPHQLHWFVKNSKISHDTLSQILPQRCYQYNNPNLKLAQLIDQARRGASAQHLQALMESISSADLLSLVYARNIWPFFQVYLAEYWQQLRKPEKTKFITCAQQLDQLFASHAELLTFPEHQFIYYLHDSTHEIYQRYVHLIKQILHFDQANNWVRIELSAQQYAELNQLTVFLPHLNLKNIENSASIILSELLEPLPLGAWLEIFPSWESVYALNEKQFAIIIKPLINRIFLEKDEQQVTSFLAHLSALPSSVAGFTDYGVFMNLFTPEQQHDFLKLRLKELIKTEHEKQPLLATYILKKPLSPTDTHMIVEVVQDEKNALSNVMKQQIFAWLSLYGTGLDPQLLNATNQYIANTLNHLQAQ